MRTLIASVIVGLVMAMTLAGGGDKAVPVFSGNYDWKDGGRDELRAEFKPTDERRWDAKFVFQFSGKRNKWKGTATGSLEDGGKISGTAGWKGRSWVFEATVEAGVLRGSHTEILRDGERYDTGTFEMRR